MGGYTKQMPVAEHYSNMVAVVSLQDVATVLQCNLDRGKMYFPMK